MCPAPEANCRANLPTLFLGFWTGQAFQSAACRPRSTRSARRCPRRVTFEVSIDVGRQGAMPSRVAIHWGGSCRRFVSSGSTLRMPKKKKEKDLRATFPDVAQWALQEDVRRRQEDYRYRYCRRQSRCSHRNLHQSYWGIRAQCWRNGSAKEGRWQVAMGRPEGRLENLPIIGAYKQ